MSRQQLQTNKKHNKKTLKSTMKKPKPKLDPMDEKDKFQ